jgi:hypothetical protein
MTAEIPSYKPPEGLPFQSRGSFEGDKREYKKIRIDLHVENEKLWREAIGRNYETAKINTEALAELEKFFGFNDDIALKVTNPRAFMSKMRWMSIVGEL